MCAAHEPPITRERITGYLRVLIVNNYARITGGADLQCLKITEGLRHRGHEVRWLATESTANVETPVASFR